MAISQDTIHNSGWHQVNGIIEPVIGLDQTLPPGVEAAEENVGHSALWWRWKAQQDSIAQARADSIEKAREDSICKAQANYGVILKPPYVDVRELPASATSSLGGAISWILVGELILFCAVCLRFRNNSRYLGALIMDLRQVKERQNLFDDTVRESSFLLLLNLLWVYSIGILLWQAVKLPIELTTFEETIISDRGALGIIICIGVATVYEIFMVFSYLLVGNVFLDKQSLQMWMQGFFASQGLQAICFFPLSLMSICYPDWMEVLLLICAFVFILCKILFILKGLRIFFGQIASILPFLYYLCSLELVPLVMSYVAALRICALWL